MLHSRIPHTFGKYLAAVGNDDADRRELEL